MAFNGAFSLRPTSGSVPYKQPTTGTVYWITGYSGAGKTTVALGLRERLERHGARPILLDGDVMRTVLGGSFGHSPEARLQLARIYARLSHEFSVQGFDVICATISMFESVRQWNRENMPRYLEAYLRVPLEQRVARDTKGLYRSNGSEVVGVTLPGEEPRSPDMVIDNDRGTVEDAVDAILLCARQKLLIGAV